MCQIAQTYIPAVIFKVFTLQGLSGAFEKKKSEEILGKKKYKPDHLANWTV